jgi:hypothetical protein
LEVKGGHVTPCRDEWEEWLLLHPLGVDEAEIQGLGGGLGAVGDL